MSKLLENQSIVLRGKAILTFLLLFKMNPQWMIIAVDLDFFKNIDKLLRDNYKYVQCCLLCMIETLSTTQIPSMITLVEESFDKLCAGKFTYDGYKSAGIRRVLKRYDGQF